VSASSSFSDSPDSRLAPFELRERHRPFEPHTRTHCTSVHAVRLQTCSTYAQLPATCRGAAMLAEGTSCRLACSSRDSKLVGLRCVRWLCRWRSSPALSINYGHYVFIQNRFWTGARHTARTIDHLHGSCVSCWFHPAPMKHLKSTVECLSRGFYSGQIF